jgi:hypothetical protein
MKSTRWKSFMLIAGILLLASCNTRRAAPQLPAQPEVKPAPATPIAEKKEQLGKPSWDPQWDAIIEKSLPPEMLSSRMERAVNRRTYWAYFFQALAGAEAGLVPTTDVRHTEPEVAVKDTVTKRMVRSEGLLQLTYMDADRYGCDFDWERDKELPEKDPGKTILQPFNNLTCGIKILDTQLVEKGKPLVSSASYWSTLQPGTVSYRVFVKQMQNVPDVCRATPAGGQRNRTAGSPNSVASVASTGSGTN